MRLSHKRIDFQISSEVFVQEYIDKELMTFDEEADAAMLDAALEMDAWGRVQDEDGRRV